jgi:hypothetical protein
MVDPEYALNREIKTITSKRKKTDEDLKEIERLEWYGGLYEDEGVIVQPTSKVRKCLINTARITKSGKDIERAIAFEGLYVPMSYDGCPMDIDAIYADPRFHSRLSVGIGKKRVMRVRPKFYPWGLEVRGVLIEDIGLNFEEFVRIVELAGKVEGIGDNRVNGYGRFIGEVIVNV